MICITVVPESRTLAKADIFNAATQGDIIELCLDHLVKEPDVKDLLSVTTKPIIVSCRRRQDGGKWDGTEDERLLLLRQAIVASPAYIELDLDIAAKIPRYGKVQRVVSFTRSDKPETDIDGIFEQAAKANADVVKFSWPTPTIDAAWPLLQAVSGKRKLPIVGQGMGRAELTFSLLGRKCGSPWLYAALEKGMEAYPGQITVSELDDLYHWREITPQTSLIAVAGFGTSQTITTKVLNVAFREMGLNVRCLPIIPSNMGQLKKMLEMLKIKAVFVAGPLGRQLLPLAEHIDPQDANSHAIDLLLKRDDGWHGYNTLWRSGLKLLEQVLTKTSSSTTKKPLESRNVIVLGNGGIAQTMVYAVTQRKGLVSICGPSEKDSQEIATQNHCRFVPFAKLYETLFDVAILADPELKAGNAHGFINPALFRPQMTMLDVTAPPTENPLGKEARLRGCRTVSPRDIFADQLSTQFKALTGKELPPAALEAGWALLGDEAEDEVV